MAKNIFLDTGRIGSRGLSPDLHINYEIIGSWKEANYLLNNPTYFKQCMDKGIRRYSKAYKEEILKHLKNEGAGLGWLPLSEDYKKFKDKYAPGEGLLRFFDVYAKSIKMIKTDGVWGVGVPTGIKNTYMESLGKGGLQVHEYAAVLEKGTNDGDVPARPLWGATFVKMGGPSTLRRFVAEAFRERFRGLRMNLPTHSKIK